MLATSTHDTKRSEDVRARINVLSEIPEEWKQAIQRWSQQNRKHKIDDDDDVIPSGNEEYLIYQTLVGSWPLEVMNDEEHQHYVKRIQEYMEKALKEAKVHSSWINPNKAYDQAVQDFIAKILADSTFLEDFKAFVSKIIPAGMLNSLSQTLLKTTSPGVPDFYQGSEIWDFRLVDPDNRHPVNFSVRKRLLQTLLENKGHDRLALVNELIQHPDDGRIKLYLIMQTLQLRRRMKILFEDGEYIPLIALGKLQNHLIAFMRKIADSYAIVISTRFFSSYSDPAQWKDHKLIIPKEIPVSDMCNVFTGVTVSPQKDSEGNMTLDLENILNPIPFALLEGVDHGS
jgi:(1->4)-alpha-D-glucan 1-alpha-D-glucosylmutase